MAVPALGAQLAGQSVDDVLPGDARKEILVAARDSDDLVRQDRAEDYGTNGKVLLDALGNRYLVPDVSALPSADNRLFTSYIYW